MCVYTEPKQVLCLKPIVLENFLFYYFNLSGFIL